MPTSPSANMNIVMPIVSSPGTDPGPAYATTVNNALMTTVDQHNHTSGKGVLVPTAGLNINADLTFNGHNLTNGGTITGTAGNFASLGTTTLAGAITGAGQNITGLGAVTCTSLTVSGAFSAGSLAATTGTVVAGSTLANSITLAGKTTGTNPTITVAGDANLGLQIVMAGTGSLQIGNAASSWTIGVLGALSGLFQGTASTALTLSGNSAATGGIAINLDNQTTQTTGTIVSFNTGGTSKGQITSSGRFQSNIGIFSTVTASTTVQVIGTAAAAGVGVALDNTVTLTTGEIVSFRNNTIEKASVGFGGQFASNAGYTTNSGQLASGTVGQGIVINSQAASAGTSLTVNNSGSVDIGGTGYIALLQSLAGTNQFAITGRGHLIPLSTAPTAPTVGSFAAGFFTTGAVSGVTLTGSDASMLLKFTTGTSCTQITEMTSLIGTITLNQGYSSTSWNGFAAFASEPTNISLSYGINDTAPLIVVPLSASTFALYAAIPFTPKLNTPYAISIFTMGAGATS